MASELHLDPGRPAPAPAAPKARPVPASADVPAVPSAPPQAASQPAPVLAPSLVPLPEPRSLQELAEALRRVNLTFDLFEVKADISVEGDGQVVVRIMNHRTGEVIRQIPSEQARRLAAALAEGRGVLTDIVA